LSLPENGHGVLLAYTGNSTITGNCITDNDYGITLLKSNDNAVENNTIECRDGIWLVRNSSRNSIFGNSIKNGGRGIFLYGSSTNKIHHVLSKKRVTLSVLEEGVVVWGEIGASLGAGLLGDDWKDSLLLTANKINK